MRYKNVEYTSSTLKELYEGYYNYENKKDN